MASGNESDEYIDPYCDKCAQEKGYHVQVSAYCKTCNLLLCVDCEINHQTLEKDEKHEVVRGEAVPSSHDERPTCYKRCDKHLKSEYYLDHFCEYHACLICSKCARKVHARAECSVVPVDAICREITSMDVKDFERVILRKKEYLVKTKLNLDTTSLKHLADQRDAVFNECQDMFNEQEAKLKCLKVQFETELEEVFNKQSKVISNQIKAIDTVVVNLDKIYKDIRTIEKDYKHEDENLFIKIQESVVKINHYLEDFRRIENSLENVTLKFLANEELYTFMTRVNSLGNLKTRIKSADSASCVDDVVFPPASRVNRKVKTRNSKYGTRRSFKFK